MKRVSLLFALSLSTILAACGVEGQKHPADDGGMNENSSTPPWSHGKPSLVTTVCGLDISFYDYPTDNDKRLAVGWVGFNNHNTFAVKVLLMQLDASGHTDTDSVVQKTEQPNSISGQSVYFDKTKFIIIFVEKLIPDWVDNGECSKHVIVP